MRVIVVVTTMVVGQAVEERLRGEVIPLSPYQILLLLLSQTAVLLVLGVPQVLVPLVPLLAPRQSQARISF